LSHADVATRTGRTCRASVATCMWHN
jgi:hypothetical protein